MRYDSSLQQNHETLIDSYQAVEASPKFVFNVGLVGFGGTDFPTGCTTPFYFLLSVVIHVL